MGKIGRVGALVLLALCTAQAEKDTKDKNPVKSVWNTSAQKIPLKRETLPSKSSSGGKSSTENFRTAAQTNFGYNGANFGGGAGGFGNGFGGGFGNGFGNPYNGQFGYSPSYQGGSGQFGQYNQLGQGAYNVLGQGNYFGAQGQNPYYSSGGGNYFGGSGGFGNYPYQSSGAYPFGGQQAGFSGLGGFGGFGNSGYFPGAQYSQNRNFGFINQGFGNPAFRNPQQGSSSTGGLSSIPSSVQVGTGLEVGNRGGGGGSGGFPSASGQNYIVGNGIGQPAFIGGSGAPGAFGGFGGGPFGGLYSTGVPGGLYRNPNSLFGGPYDYPRALSASTGSSRPSSVNSSRQSSSATRLQTSGPNRFYQGVGPAGTYAPSSRERLYRYTSNES